MQSKRSLQSLSFLSRSSGLCLSLGLVLGLTSTGCDQFIEKGDKQSEEENKKQETREEQDTADQVGNKDEAQVDAQVVEELQKKLPPASLNALKESCEEICEKGQPKCGDQGDGQDNSKAGPERESLSCANRCATGLSDIFAMSEAPSCLQELQDVFACTFDQECKELSASSGQLEGLIMQATKPEDLVGPCKDALKEVSEHCAEDFKKKLGEVGGHFPGDGPIDPGSPFPGGDGPINPDQPFPGDDKPLPGGDDPEKPKEPLPGDDGPNKPKLPPVGFQAMLGSVDLAGAQALAWVNEKGVYSFAISNSNMNCETPAERYKHAIAFESEVTTPDARLTTVRFYNEGEKYFSEIALVLVRGPMSETVELGIEAKSMDGKYWARGTLKAKLCK